MLSQSATQAEGLFNNKQYNKAKEAYEILLKRKPNDQLYNYRLGRCLYELKDYESAISYLKLSGSKYPMKDYYLGESCFNSYRFGEAVSYYSTYVSTLTSDDKTLPEIETKLQHAEMADKLLNRVEDISLIDSTIVSKNDFLQFYKISKETGSLKLEKLKSGNKTFDKVTYTTQRGDRKIISDTIKGNIQLLSTYKLLDDWSAPVSISDQINTKANENYPFLMLDGVTLYFASDGKNSIGGYDIFITKYSPNAKDFLTPENIGFPFNSPANDYMLVIDEPNQKGWFASDRFSPAGKVTLYSFVANELKSYVRTDDSTMLRKYAQLKKANKALKYNKINNYSTTDNTNRPESNFIFVINDSTVYKSPKDFKNNETSELWIELNNLKEQLQKNTMQLNEYRYKVATADNKESVKDLTEPILLMESKQVEIQKAITALTKKVRLLETNYSEKN